MSGAAAPIVSAAAARPERRLFDREADNHHCDGLLVAQLASRCLHECIASGGSATATAPLQRQLAAAAVDALAEACAVAAAAPVRLPM